MISGTDDVLSTAAAPNICITFWYLVILYGGVFFIRITGMVHLWSNKKRKKKKCIVYSCMIEQQLFTDIYIYKASLSCRFFIKKRVSFCLSCSLIVKESFVPYFLIFLEWWLYVILINADQESSRLATLLGSSCSGAAHQDNRPQGKDCWCLEEALESFNYLGVIQLFYSSGRTNISSG